MERPINLENLSLNECAKQFYVKRTRWVSRRKAAVEAVFHRQFSMSHAEYETLKMEAILYVPWRSVNVFDVSADELLLKLQGVGRNSDLVENFDFVLEWNESGDQDYFDEEDCNEFDDDDDWQQKAIITLTK